MAVLPVTAETIAHIHQGAAGLLLDREIAKAVEDLLDRGPEDKKVRKVAVTLEFELMAEDQVNVRVAAQAKLPPAYTGLNLAQVKADGRGKQKLVFQAYAPEDPRQNTIDDAMKGQ